MTRSMQEIEHDDMKAENDRQFKLITKLRLFLIYPMSDFDNLSDQEIAISKLAIKGMTNKEIGKELDLAPSTVGTKLYRMGKKIGLSKSGLIRHFYLMLDLLYVV